MRIKWAGETRLRAGELAEVQNRPLQNQPGRAPLPTGWLGLDLATNVGGLPRDTMVTLTGKTDEQARDFVFTLIANWQNLEHPPVAVVDVAADFAQDKVRHTDVDYKNLTVVRTNQIDEGVDAARALLIRADHNAVLLHCPQLDDEPEFTGLLARISAAVRKSASAGLVNLGQNPSSPLTPALRLWLEAGHRLRMTGEHEAEVEIPADDQGRPDRLPDLVTGGLMTNAIEQTGATYHVGGRSVRGRRNLVRLLSEDSDLALSLENKLDRQSSGLRNRAAWKLMRTDKVGAVLVGDVQSISAGIVGIRETNAPTAPTGYVVNTWFDADGEAHLPLRVGQPYEFHVRIGQPESHVSGMWSLLGTVPDFGGHEWLELIATLHSRDFAVTVRTRQFRLHKTAGSDLVTFAVVPRHVGYCTLRVTISTARELELLHKVELDVPVEEETGS